MQHDLIARARAGLAGSRRPRGVFLRRSVSDAYYAVFHALALLCSDQLVGVTKRGSQAWKMVYRGLDHAKARQELQKNAVRTLDPAIARIGAAFTQLQEERHEADYNPVSALRRRSDVEPFILLAEAAVADIESLPPDLGQELATILSIKLRP